MRHQAVALLITSTIIGLVGALGVPTAAMADVRTPAMGGFGALAAPLLEPFGAIDPNELARGADPSHPTSRGQAGVASQIVDVTVGWNALSAEQRRDAIERRPALVGNLDGIPYDTRSSLNASRLSEALATTPAGTETAAKLRNVSAALRSAPDGPERSLLLFDTAGPWRTAIALGDVATADYVTYLIPGMFFTSGEQTDDWAARAQSLYEEQREWLVRLGRADATIAVVSWIGYPSPEVADSTSLAGAREGANRIESVLVALRTLRAGNEPHVTVVAHSYGSTATLLALQRQSVSVDALVLLGSPGSDALSADALSVIPGGVYSSSAPFDPVSVSDFFGSNPMSPGYGATVLGVEGGIDPVSCTVLTGSVGHNEYFSAGTHSMRNLALVGIDRGDLAARPLND